MNERRKDHISEVIKGVEPPSKEIREELWNSMKTTYSMSKNRGESQNNAVQSLVSKRRFGFRFGIAFVTFSVCAVIVWHVYPWQTNKISDVKNRVENPKMFSFDTEKEEKKMKNGESSDDFAGYMAPGEQATDIFEEEMIEGYTYSDEDEGMVIDYDTYSDEDDGMVDDFEKTDEGIGGSLKMLQQTAPSSISSNNLSPGSDAVLMHKTSITDKILTFISKVVDRILSL